VKLVTDAPVISKDAPTQVLFDEVFTYTITVQNSLGYSLTSVTITDVVPGNVDFAYPLDGGVESGGLVTWNVGSIPDQASVSVRFAVTATNVITTTTNDVYAVSASNYTTTTFGAPVSTIVLNASGGVCGDPAVYIHDIQGSGNTSPLAGASSVVIEGVVVGDYQSPGGGIDGFFVQEEDADADADTMTSEGIFVYDGAFGVAVQPGDVVRATGTVVEYYGLTELKTLSEVLVCRSGAAVTPVTVTLPIADLANWEWYEGMSLYIPQTLYVTEHYNLGRYGQVSLSVYDRLYNPTQVAAPGTAANTLQALNDRSRVQLDDARTDQNPDPIIYPSPELSATNTLRGGDTLPNLIGVLYYSFGSYLIEPVAPLAFTHSNPRPAATTPVSGTLKVASFNVLNYFTTIDTGAAICGPTEDMDCRGADSAAEFTRQRDKIINAILAIDADIVGLMEMENHPTDAALDDLVDGLNAIAGAGTYAKIATDTIGGDAIKVAFIYKPSTVTPAGAHAILDDTFDADYYDDYNRPALAQTFQEDATGEEFTIVVNHFKSKGSDCNAIGDPDTGDGQGNCNLTRTSAANVMLDWLATDPTSSGDPRFLVIGDLNSYALEDPIMALAGGGFTDLYSTLGGDNYSYVFDGQWGTLDYGLANAAMLHYVTGATAWHINSDEPYVLDYNEEYKSAYQINSLYSPGPYRASDHDPIVISLDLTKAFIMYLPLVNR
ncbi:MAG: ExeM/NucH family extracellular endonuclease, partial [Chloroflexi bacterium]|nr:ExeM/NucH family extracellular endonuclease [Chloroflexota bacterium]